MCLFHSANDTDRYENNFYFNSEIINEEFIEDTIQFKKSYRHEVRCLIRFTMINYFKVKHYYDRIRIDNIYLDINPKSLVEYLTKDFNIEKAKFDGG